MVRRRSYKSAIKKLRPFIKGAVAGTVTAAVFTVIGAFLFNIADAPEGADITFGYISLGAASGVCGMFWGGGRGKNGFAVLQYLRCVLSERSYREVFRVRQ